MPPSDSSPDVRAYYDLNRKVYVWFAPWYDALVAPLRSFRRTVVKSAGLPAGAWVLDAATGTGAQARAFAEAGYQVAGIDLSGAMLRVARRKNRLPNLTFQRADATNLPFQGGTFDAACISFALHEMPKTVREKALVELTRVTKVGGTVVVIDYGLPRNPVWSRIVFELVKLYERDHYAEFVRSDLGASLRKAGIHTKRYRAALLGTVRVSTGARIHLCAAPPKPRDAGS